MLKFIERIICTKYVSNVSYEYIIPVILCNNDISTIINPYFIYAKIKAQKG